MTDASGQRQRAEANCHQCGMVCQPNEYHPHAACVLYGATHDGAAVRANLNAIGQHVRQEALREAVVVAMKYRDQARQQDLSGGYTSELIATELDHLAREGVK